MPSLWARPNGPANQFAVNQASPNRQAALLPVLPATITIGTTTETVIPHPQNSAQALILPLSPNQGNEATPFDLIVSGILTLGTTGNLVLRVYSGTSLTPANNSVIAAPTLTGAAASFAPFELHLHLIYDSVSGKLHGYSEVAYFNGTVPTLLSKAAITAQSGINDNNNPVITFLLSVAFSVANAGNQLVVRNFSAG